jgi:alpha-1,2-mannosyltransferase
MTAAYLLDRAGYPVPALLATALTGLLVSPVSWDHHWVWVAPAIAVAGHYAVTGSQRTARRLWCLAAFMFAVFAAWPDALWENARNLGNFSLGLLWAQGNTDPVLFAQHGDQPWYVEYHWHGFQLLWGNAYILAGVALLVILLVAGFRLPRDAAAAAVSAREPVPAATPAS